MDPTLQQLATDIGHIKLFLYVSILLLLVVAAMLVFASIVLVKAAKNTELRADRRQFQEHAGNLMQQAKYEELKKLTVERLSEAPGDEWAHYYAATAHYRTGSLVEAKKYYLRAGELSPLLRRECEETVKELEATLAASKPKSVK